MSRSEQIGLGVVVGLVVAALLLQTIPVMAQPSLTRYAIFESPDFQKRMQFLAVRIALEVMDENPDTLIVCAGGAGKCTAQELAQSQGVHRLRAALAYRTLHEPQIVANRIALGVATNTTLTLQSSDADVENVIRAQWNAYAQVDTLLKRPGTPLP